MIRLSVPGFFFGSWMNPAIRSYESERRREDVPKRTSLEGKGLQKKG